MTRIKDALDSVGSLFDEVATQSKLQSRFIRQLEEVVQYREDDSAALKAAHKEKKELKWQA